MSGPTVCENHTTISSINSYVYFLRCTITDALSVDLLASCMPSCGMKDFETMIK